MKISLKWFSLGTTITLIAMIVFALLTVTPLFGESKMKPLVFNASSRSVPGARLSR